MSKQKDDVPYEDLIDAVKRCSCLWQTEDDGYNARAASSIAWTNISNELKTDVRTIKIKWKMLRDIFRREHKNHGGATLEDYAGKWRHYEALWFLKDSMKINLEEVAIKKKMRKMEMDNYFLTIEGMQDSDEAEDPLPIKKEVRDDNSIYFETNASESDREEEPEIKPKRRKKSKVEDDGEDYDLMYLKSLLPFFKKLNSVRKLAIRTKIQDLLLNELQDG